MSFSLFPRRIPTILGITVMITLVVISNLLFIRIIPGPTWAAWLTLSLSLLIFMYYTLRFYLIFLGERSNYTYNAADDAGAGASKSVKDGILIST